MAPLICLNNLLSFFYTYEKYEPLSMNVENISLESWIPLKSAISLRTWLAFYFKQKAS